MLVQDVAPILPEAALANLMFHAAIFDMDGTLLDSERVIMRAWLEAAAALQCTLPAETYVQVIGLNEQESDALLVAALGGTEMYEAVRLAAAKSLDAPADRVIFPVRHGVAPLLAALRARGVPCAVASSSAAAEIEDRLRRAGIRDHFTAVAGGDEVPRGKPDPAVYRLAASRLGVAASACIAFEDSEHGATAALRAGARVVFVPDMRAPSERIASALFSVLETLEDAVPHVPAWFADAAWRPTTPR
jgi:HAD superfamily hydrolase (TIGR01509 family)